MIAEDVYTLITGAAGGFGRTLTVECAARNMNIIATDVPGSGLDGLANFIRRNYNVKVISIESDLAATNGCEMLYNHVKLQNALIGILVNNAGIGGSSFFDDKSADYYAKQVYLNTVVPTILCRLFLDDLKHTRGYILNVASLAAFFMLPGKQVYAASKNYIVSFSKALQAEMKRYNVHVSVVCPGGMDTTLDLIIKHKQCSWLSRMSVMQPQQVARIAINGLLSGKKLIIPGFINRLFLCLGKMLPQSASKSLSEKEIKRLIINSEVCHVAGSIAS